MLLFFVDIRNVWLDIKKNRELFVAVRGSGIPVLQTRKLADCSVSVSAFFCSTEIYQISDALRKAKTLLIYVFVLYLISVSCDGD